MARAPPSRTRGRSGGARVAPRCASRARRCAGAAGGAIEHRAPLDRGADVLAAHRHARLDAPRRAGGRLRRRRRAAARRASSSRDWPDRGRRSIFYPPSLLAQLGWPADADRLAAARARFHDLLRLARVRVSVSTFTLEDDAIVPASAFLEELETAGLPIERTPPARPLAIFVHEAVSEDPVAAAALGGVPLEWLALRASRSPAVGRHVPRRRWRARGGRLRGQQHRALPRVPVQVLRRVRAAAARGARRGVGTDAAGARTVPSRGVRSVLRRVAGVGPRQP